MKMEGASKETALPEMRGQQWDSLRSLVRGLEEEHDLEGLASVAETGLVAMRQLCERPLTCLKLDEMLDGLRSLVLDPWELGEEQ